MRMGGAGKQMSGPQLPSWWNAPASQTPSQRSEQVSGNQEPPTPSGSDRPLVAARRDRVVVSFSSFSAGVTIFAFVALLAGGFLAGREVGMRQGEERGYAAGVRMLRAETADEIEMARGSKPNSDIFSGLRSSPITTASTPKSTSATSGKRTLRSTPKNARKPASSPQNAQPKSSASHEQKWITNYTYVIVQEFRSEDQADALEAREFLRGHGVSTTILESRGRYKYRLVADKGFNCDDANQRKWCDEFHGKIQVFGKLYVKAGGRYDLQGYQKKLTGAGW